MLKKADKKPNANFILQDLCIDNNMVRKKGKSNYKKSDLPEIVLVNYFLIHDALVIGFDSDDQNLFSDT